MDKIQYAQNLLKIYNQEHIIKWMDNLKENEKKELVNQINQIDFHLLTELYQSTKKEIEIKENKIEEIKYLDKAKLSKEQKETLDKLGEKTIQKGEYAVVTMAGGQGTRLEHQKEHLN